MQSIYGGVVATERRYIPSFPDKLILGDLKWYTEKGHLNIKALAYQYKNSHHKDNMVWRRSYPYNGNAYTSKDGLYIDRGPGILQM